MASYSLTWNYQNKGTNTTISKVYNSSVTAPTPTFTGCIFNGWSTIPAGIVSLNGGAIFNMPAYSITYYAIWTIVFNLTWNYQTKGTDTTIVTAFNSSVTAPTPTFTGYIFNGWSTSSTGNVSLNGGTVFNMPGNDITYYAIWTIIVPSSGPISLTNNIGVAFLNTKPIKFSNYYRSTPIIPSATSTYNIPMAGPLKFSNFRGTSKPVIITYINSIQTSINTNDVRYLNNISFSIPYNILYISSCTVIPINGFVAQMADDINASFYSTMNTTTIKDSIIFNNNSSSSLYGSLNTDPVFDISTLSLKGANFIDVKDIHASYSGIATAPVLNLTLNYYN